MGIKIWKAVELKSLGPSLAPKVDALHVASQALADFGNYNALVVHREASGEAEWHENAADLMVVQSGEGALTLGGTIEGGYSMAPGEIRGASIDGGESYPVAPGDIINIPAKTPHRMMLAPGGNITYFLVKLPVAHE